MEDIPTVETLNSPKQAQKRKQATDNQDESLKNENESTPKKDKAESLRSDVPYSTPILKRLQYDFWTTDEDEVSESDKVASTENDKESKANISDLKSGTYMTQTVRFRVTYKSELKQTSYGSVLSFHGLDESGEICFVSFREEAEKYYDMIQINDVHKATNFNVKEESTKYRSGTGHNFQVMLHSKSCITKEEIEGNTPPIPFNLMPIKTLKGMKEDLRVDIIGVLVKDWGMHTTKNNYVKRDIALSDAPKITVNVTLWGSEATNFAIPLHTVIAVRKGCTAQYEGITSLNSRFDTLLWANPVLKECAPLKEWFTVDLEKKKQKSK